MAYNILGVNPGHNGSVALVSDGEVVYYLEEERLSRQKYDGNPFRGILDILSKWHVDEVVIAGTTNNLPTLPWTGEDPYTALVRKFNPNVRSTRLGHEHHLGHAACAFYNSGFEEAVAVIVDGAGSFKVVQNEQGQDVAAGFETESIWYCKQPSSFGYVRKFYGSNEGHLHFTDKEMFEGSVTTTKAYEAVSQYLGFGFIEAGKTMGLAPYGERDENIPELFVNDRGNKNVFIPNYPAGAYIDQNRNSYLRQNDDPKTWHNDPSKLTVPQKNLAWRIQHDTQKLVGDLIDRAVQTTGLKNVVIAGGYGLNCVANYYFLQRFPDVNFYFEPIAHDGGTSIGVAMLAWHGREESENSKIKPQTSLYHGPKYTVEQYEETLKKNGDFIKTQKVSYSDIAKLIAERNIVALFQGRSEAGPRALGNRSILYDPRDPDGKDHVNVVKGREWFRPFAASCLAEDAKEWFDLRGLNESPFMMLAVNVVADKVKQIPCVSHVDDTCRVQTVTEEQNKHYYNVIKAFKELTGVPLVFNTSLNLAGDPLCETLEDAIQTLLKSQMEYLYLPELELLVTKST
jgi:carbamoyltransferase